jgi:hypothetical protein
VEDDMSGNRAKREELLSALDAALESGEQWTTSE